MRASAHLKCIQNQSTALRTDELADKYTCATTDSPHSMCLDGTAIQVHFHYKLLCITHTLLSMFIMLLCTQATPKALIRRVHGQQTGIKQIHELRSTGVTLDIRKTISDL